MSKCKAVLDGDKITSIAVKAKPSLPSSPTGASVTPKNPDGPKQVSTATTQKSK